MATKYPSPYKEAGISGDGRIFGKEKLRVKRELPTHRVRSLSAVQTECGMLVSSKTFKSLNKRDWTCLKCVRTIEKIKIHPWRNGKQKS